MLGKVAATEEIVFEGLVRRLSPAGARVLEVGGAMPPERIEAAGVASWVSIDPRNEEGDALGGRYRRIRGRSGAVPLAEASVDMVFSCNAFEHIADLPATLGELSRVLRPGGVVYAHFGPIWSGPDGHHLETVAGGRPWNFWEHGVIPHWAHLALPEADLGDLLARALPGPIARELARWVFHSDDLNRNSYEDYLAAFTAGHLSLVHLETSEEVDYPFTPPDGLPMQLLPQARARLGPHRNLSCRDILAVLRREGAPGGAL